MLGNERHGLEPGVLARCDAVVQLPCRGVKNSMNVAVSAGMCGYEVVRQWSASAAAAGTCTSSASEVPVSPVLAGEARGVGLIGGLELVANTTETGKT